VIAVSGEIPKRLVMSGGGLEREAAPGELGNVKPMTKLRRERYLQSRRVTADLLSTTTRTDELQSGDFKGGSVSIGDVQKERGRGSAASFIGRASAVEEEIGEAQFTRCHCGLMEPLMAPFTRRVKPPLKVGTASPVGEEGRCGRTS